MWSSINWPGNVLWSVIYVERLVNVRWDGSDLRSKLLLDLVKVESVFPIDEVDSKTEMTESSRSANAMDVILTIPVNPSDCQPLLMDKGFTYAGRS